MKPAADSSLDVEAAMLAAEDEEDIAAMRVTKEEIAKEMDEFDEDAPVENLDEGQLNTSLNDQEPNAQNNNSSISAAKAVKLAPVEGDILANTIDQEANDERDMEKEFANWQAKVGHDFRALENALKPVERYALRYRTEIDPYYSLFYISDQMRLEALKEEQANEQWDVEEIEKEKEEEVPSQNKHSILYLYLGHYFSLFF